MTNAIMTNDPITECLAALAVTPPATICARQALERARRELQGLERDVEALCDDRRAPYERELAELKGLIYRCEQRVRGLEEGQPCAWRDADNRASPEWRDAATFVLPRAYVAGTEQPMMVTPRRDRETRSIPSSRRLPAERAAETVVAVKVTRTMIVKGPR